MTLTIKFGLDNVNLNQHAKYPSKSSFRSKIIVWTDPTSTIRMVEPRRREIRLANLNNWRHFRSGDSQREHGQVGGGRFTDDVVDANTEHRGTGALVSQRQVDAGPSAHLQVPVMGLMAKGN